MNVSGDVNNNSAGEILTGGHGGNNSITVAGALNKAGALDLRGSGDVVSVGVLIIRGKSWFSLADAE